MSLPEDVEKIIKGHFESCENKFRLIVSEAIDSKLVRVNDTKVDVDICRTKHEAVHAKIDSLKEEIRELQTHVKKTNFMLISTLIGFILSLIMNVFSRLLK